MSNNEKHKLSLVSDPDEYILREEERESYDTAYLRKRRFLSKSMVCEEIR